MDVIRLKLSNIRYLANSTVPHFIFQGEEDVATVWDGRIEEPRRLGVNGRHDLCKAIGKVKIFYTEPDRTEDQKGEEENQRPSGYLKYIDCADEESGLECSFDVYLYVRKKYIWEFYLDRICSNELKSDVALRIQIEGLSMGWEPDGSGQEWEDASEPLWIKGFSFEHEI